MEKFKMQFVHPRTESEFIDWMNSPVKSIVNKTNHILVEASEDGETCYMTGGCLDRISKILMRLAPQSKRLWHRKMKRVNKLNR